MKKTVLTMAAAASATMMCAKDARPNIVWIFADDHSYQAIGAYGSRLSGLNPTPNIDKLAKEGMIFNESYVANSICGPSRATLLTGKHSWKNGKITNWKNCVFNQNQETFPKLLQKAGYQTALFGKIHLEGKMQGFDDWKTLVGQGWYNDSKFLSEKGVEQIKGYVTDVITRLSLDWLKNKRDPNKPFMLMIHHKAAHRVWTPAPRYMNKYKDVTIPVPDNFFDDYSTRTTAAHKQQIMVKDLKLKQDLKVTGDPSYKHGQYADRNKYYLEHKESMTDKEMALWKYQLYMKDYLRCVASIDDSVKEVMDYLKKSGLEKNTVVFYSSDQGFFNGEHGWYDKRFMYEQAFRTPLIVRWPGVIKPGSVNNDLVQNIDWAETFLDIAGAPIPDDMDGVSIVPLLKGKKPSNWRKALYYHYYEFPGCGSIRRHEGVYDGRFKLIRFYGPKLPHDEWELYDLKNDPEEMDNIYNKPEMKNKVGELKTTLSNLKRQYNVPADDAKILKNLR